MGVWYHSKHASNVKEIDSQLDSSAALSATPVGFEHVSYSIFMNEAIGNGAMISTPRAISRERNSGGWNAINGDDRVAKDKRQ